MTETKVTKNDNSTVVFEGSIPAADIDKHKSAALKKLGASVTIDGFRPGHVPEDILIKHIGEYQLLEEMANRALSEHYPKLLIEHKIDAIGRPEVVIKKLAHGNPLEYTITTAVMPQITLGDYKTAAREVIKNTSDKELEVKDDEVDAFIKNILADYAQREKLETPPELSDDLAKKFGNFESAADMRAKIKDGMLVDKRREQVEKKRLAILEAIVVATPFALPELVIEAETEKLMARFMMDLERMGITSKDYFERTGKDEKTFRDEVRPDAEKRARIQLIINEIALTEKLTPTKDEIEKEVDRVLAGHEPHEGHDEKKERESATVYVATILTNEKVLKFLEELA